MGQASANIPLEFAIASVMICHAISNLQQSQQGKMLAVEEQNELLETSYRWCSQFMNQITSFGYRVEHTSLVLRYCKYLQDAVNCIEITNTESINQIRRMME